MEDTQTCRLKTIFDICDEDNDGYVDITHFASLARDHFGGEGFEEITGVVNLLDPDGRQRISFEEFCKGVAQINDLQNQAQLTRIKSNIAEDTLVPLETAGHLSSLQKTSHLKQSTFIKYDFDDLDLTGSNDEIKHLKCEVPGHNASNSSLLPPASEDEGDSVLSGRSSEINENSRPEITDEENYEDCGEVESETDISDKGLDNIPITNLVGYASDNCNIMVGPKDSILSRLKGKKPDIFSSHKRVTSSYISLVQQSTCDQRSGIGSGEIFDDIDGNFQDLNERVKYLESQLFNLMDTQAETTAKQARLRDENSILTQKVISLEEQLKDMEMKDEEHIKEDKRKHQEYLNRYNKEKMEEMEYITKRLQHVEREYEDLREDALTLRQQLSNLRSENIDLKERIIEKQEMYNMLCDDYERLKVDYHHQHELYEKESQFNKQILDDLGKELEELRKREQSIYSASGLNPESLGCYRELQEAMCKLQKENQTLRDNNDDLNAQLMGQCIEEGKSLLMKENGKTIAEELHQLTKEELLAQLHSEREFNRRLKEYVDRIIITILDKNPSLLEVRTGS